MSRPVHILYKYFTYNFSLNLKRPLLKQHHACLCSLSYANWKNVIKTNKSRTNYSSFTAYPASTKISSNYSEERAFPDFDKEDRKIYENSLLVQINDPNELVINHLKNVEQPFSEWESFIESIVSNCENHQQGITINNNNVHGLIMKACLHLKLFDSGLAFMDYLLNLKKEINVSTISRYFELCYAFSDKCDENIKSRILTLYDELSSRFELFDATTAELCILGLSITHRWKEGLKLQDEIKLSCTSVSITSASALIAAAFRNDEPDVGWELLYSLIAKERKPEPVVSIEWVNYCVRNSGGDKELTMNNIEKLLNVMRDIYINPSKEVAELIAKEIIKCTDKNWEGYSTRINDRGVCQNCQQILKHHDLNKDEFMSLQKTFFDKAVIGTDIFIKSTPRELKEFQDFVDATVPYDIVLDGLNVAFSGGKDNYKNRGAMLCNVVKYFVEKSMKVLVIGRKHMTNWSPKHMNYIKKNAVLFLAQNVSQDDPFVLYAAMKSGLGTGFVTRDLMRNQLFLLNNFEQKSYFKRWQLQHQYIIVFISLNGKVGIKSPPLYDPSPQKSEIGSWHIPYDSDYKPTVLGSLEEHHHWMCVGPKVISNNNLIKPRKLESRTNQETNRPSKPSNQPYNKRFSVKKINVKNLFDDD